MLYNNSEHNISILKEKFFNIKKLGWINSQFKGKGAAGLTFEHLLGKEIENFEIPDFFGIEIKTKQKNSKQDIRLFNATPDSYLFEIKRLYNQYGFIKNNHKVFYLSITGNKIVTIKNKYYFKLIFDKINRQIILKIFDNYSGQIDDKIRWSFDLLIEKLKRKIPVLALINVEKKKTNQGVYFKYTDINFFILVNPTLIIKLIEMGVISISFNITEKCKNNDETKIYDHGTSFSIKKENLNKLFKSVI